MADLVSSLESALNSAADVSSKLREQVQRFDQYMKDSTKGDGLNHVLHSALPTALIGATANKPARSINESGSVSTIQTDITGPMTNSSQQTRDKVPARITRSQTVHLDSEIVESSATQQAETVGSTGAEDAEALPMFQLPDDAFIEWPVDSDFGGAFDYLGEVNDGSILDGAGVDDHTE